MRLWTIFLRFPRTATALELTRLCHHYHCAILPLDYRRPMFAFILTYVHTTVTLPNMLSQHSQHLHHRYRLARLAQDHHLRSHSRVGLVLACWQLLDLVASSLLAICAQHSEEQVQLRGRAIQETRSIRHPGMARAEKSRVSSISATPKASSAVCRRSTETAAWSASGALSAASRRRVSATSTSRSPALPKARPSSPADG